MRILLRSDWGADTTLKRRGHPIGPQRRTEVYIHHTAIDDNDNTPNEWETISDVKARMRQLQRVRPDLGWDVPYSFVAFFMHDDELVLCEGRGLERTGAHTTGHNRSALGIAFYGNFESGAVPSHFNSGLMNLGEWLRELRRQQGFQNLGNSRPPGRQVWGHRDAQLAATLCPGTKLYSMLPLIRFIDEEDETAMDEQTWKLVQRALQALDRPLYSGRAIDGKPGRNTNIAIHAFEKRMGLRSRGVVGVLGDSQATIWPATRELLIAATVVRIDEIG